MFCLFKKLKKHLLILIQEKTFNVILQSNKFVVRVLCFMGDCRWSVYIIGQASILLPPHCVHFVLYFLSLGETAGGVYGEQDRPLLSPHSLGRYSGRNNLLMMSVAESVRFLSAPAPKNKNFRLSNKIFFTCLMRDIKLSRIVSDLFSRPKFTVKST